MTAHACSDELSQRAAAVEATFRVRKGLYLIGSLERGVTVYSQQVRAHNLVWALWQLSRDERRRPCRVAIVGGGIAGLTVAACLLSRFDQSVSVTVFEQLWDFCPMQQGADHRWLHPRIYDWPAPGSRAPSASLPVLNWSEGRASDVARTAISEFGRYCNGFGGDGRLTLYFGLKHFQIDVSNQQVEWIASRVDWNANHAGSFGVFLHGGRQEGASSAFDIIILATRIKASGVFK